MTNPQSGPRFVAGAIDLGEVKARAEARAKVEEARQKRAREAAANQQAAANGATPANSSGPGGPGAAGQAGFGGTAANAQAAADAGVGTHGPATGGGVSPVVEATPENFETDVLRRSLQVPVVIQVGTSRSPESDQMRADFEALAKQDNLAWIFAYLDADALPDLAQMLGVQRLPTVLALAGGRPLTNFEGGQSRESLREFMDAVLRAVGDQLPGIPEEERGADNAGAEAEPSDPRFDAAEEALNNGDFAAAVARYDEILAAEPNNAQAKAARGNVRLLQRVAEARSQGVTGEPEATFLAADELMISAREEEAFALLLDALRASSGDQKTAVKDRLVELLGLCDPTDPRVMNARREMASALF